MIKIDDVLHFLVANTLTPSTLGAQLERIQFGLFTTPDPFRARDDAELRILEQAELLRAVDQFTEVPQFTPPTARGLQFANLNRIQRGTSPQLCQGAIALNILRAYQQWSPTPNNQERALVAVYGYIRSINPKICPSFENDTNAVLAAQSFREDKAKRAKQLAAGAYADALVALGTFLTKRRRNAHPRN